MISQLNIYVVDIVWILRDAYMWRSKFKISLMITTGSLNSQDMISFMIITGSLNSQGMIKILKQ